jgi:hypothetical protein
MNQAMKQSLKKWARQIPMARWLKRVLIDSSRKNVVGAPQKTLRAPSGEFGPYGAQNILNFQTYWLAVEQNYRTLANRFQYHEVLVETLQNFADVTLLPLFELDSADPANRRLVGLRYDIDDDPVTGVRAARALARRGICGSFYLLHTSAYYGVMVGDRFVRRPELENWVLSFVVAGCELGLHNDAFGVCKLFGKNGAQAVIDEIQWLREFGATIRGTVAHNSGPVYGAENYEVFKEYVHWPRNVQGLTGQRLPLGALSAAELGLTYEGTFSRTKANIDKKQALGFLADLKNADVRSESWMRRFLLDNPYRDFTLDFQFWLVGRDQWIFAGRHDGKEYYRCPVNLAELFEIFKQIPRGTRTLFVLHPEYFRL